MTGKYDFNLLLLDGDVYPFVARQLEAHIGRIRQMRDFVLERGGKYAMFHTNSFRLPEERPLVRRLKQFLDGFEPFLGWMPELEKYLFDAHWTSASNEQAATVMIRLLTEKGYLPLEQPAFK